MLHFSGTATGQSSLSFRSNRNGLAFALRQGKVKFIAFHLVAGRSHDGVVTRRITSREKENSSVLVCHVVLIGTKSYLWVGLIACPNRMPGFRCVRGSPLPHGLLDGNSLWSCLRLYHLCRKRGHRSGGDKQGRVKSNVHDVNNKG